MQPDRQPSARATPALNTLPIPARLRRLQTRIWSALRCPLRRFAADQGGLVSTETVLVLPLVIWAFAATFVYFDVFRHITTGQKAATLIGDTLSRMRDIPVDAQQLERMNALFAYLAEAKHPTNIRVSSIGWNAEDEEYLLIWSYSTGWLSTSGWQPSSPTAPSDDDGRRTYYDAPLTNEVVNGPIGTTLPRLVLGETIILVESQIIFEPLFRVGVAGRTLRQQIATRPRFAPQLTFERDGEVIEQPTARPS
ncbi:hypothetical protein SAMN04488238_10220 [Roseicitreum antarcticum]|uniref:TadE-like protein n=2 Tax=Roseicitreum antarcticum TaxID=564137 RepID=A0A1H2TDM0_9RHOB|nr:hypothetical protein SAMN04488238_10220 [Roseicitreum antarcticum]